VPHSEAWFEHWAERYDRFLATGDGNWLNGITLEWHDAMLARVDRQALEEEIRQTPWEADVDIAGRAVF
jgi:hypothetical protein